MIKIEMIKLNLGKKAQETETIILIVATILIVLIASLFTFYISFKSDTIKNRITGANKDVQSKIFLLNLLNTNIMFDGREITVTEAINLLSNSDKSKKSHQDDMIELSKKISNILHNFRGYDGKTKVWQLGVYTANKDLKKSVKEKKLFEVSQIQNLGGYDTNNIEAELDFPSISETLGQKYVIKLITLED